MPGIIAFPPMAFAAASTATALASVATLEVV